MISIWIFGATGGKKCIERGDVFTIFMNMDAKDMSRHRVLDCTLRDGGYVNNWEFDTDTARAIIEGIYNSGIRYIEIGILGNHAAPGKQTKFNTIQEAEPLLEDRRADCHYAVILTQESTGDFHFPVKSERTPDCIRVAYFKRGWREALAMAADIMDKGYEVFLQSMATFMYSPAELEEMIRAVNKLGPAAFYIVDSFSTMYPDDVAAMRDQILAQLSEKIALGFHAHNNLQMAFANVQRFLRVSSKRELFVDSSVFGMGRGAGNVPTELLLAYFNQRCGEKYDTSAVLNVYQAYLKPIYEQYGWGYTLPYFLTATQQVNSGYAWYFMSHGVDDLNALHDALSRIPADTRYKLTPGLADEIMERLRKYGE